ncbi:MAG: hypothetical protein II796_02605 [Oscillospiraceae bacterium]|nr:hypothetical protein [Oscillospiraceae bacterium]
MKILGDVLATIICENLLLIYGLGIKRLFIGPEKQMKKEKIIFLLFLSSSLTFIFFCFFKLILGGFIANYTTVPIIIFVCELLSLTLQIVVLTNFNFVGKIKITMLSILFDPLLMGVNLICIYREYTIFQGIWFIFCTYVGYILTTYLVAAQAGNLNENQAIPKAFRGKPLLLIYIGILSMACYGMLGQQIFN